MPTSGTFDSVAKKWHNLAQGTKCGVIKQNQSEVGQFQFSFFPTNCMHNFYSYILQKTLLKLVDWFRRYEQLKDAKNNRKQKTFSVLFGSILKLIFPTSDWFCLITSQILAQIKMHHGICAKGLLISEIQFPLHSMSASKQWQPGFEFKVSKCNHSP